jgi:hypothetical protein
VCEQVVAGVVLSTGGVPDGRTLAELCAVLSVDGFVVPPSIQGLRLRVTRLVSGATLGVAALTVEDGSLRMDEAAVNILPSCGADSATVLQDDDGGHWLALMQMKTGKGAKFLDALVTTDPWRQFEPKEDRAKQSHSPSSFCHLLRAAHHDFLRAADHVGVLRVVVHGGGFAPSLVRRVNDYNRAHPRSPIVLFGLTDTTRFRFLGATFRSLGAMADDGSPEKSWNLRSPRAADADAPAAGAGGAAGGGGRRRRRAGSD